MSGDRPLVSVVIPVFNAAQYLPQALESVLAQACPSLQLIVVDDGSEDGAADAVAPFLDRVEYVRQPHRGIGAARNAGVERARGRLIAFLDADDLFTPHKLQVQLQHLEAHPDVDLVFGHVEEFISDELDEVERRKLMLRTGPQPGYFAQAMLIRREAFDRVGPFEEGLREAEFLDWYARARDAGLCHALLADVVFRRRLHRCNNGRHAGRDRGDLVRVVKAAMDRRRSRGR
ncbi:MAG: glycosyltransferase family 2 protein [Vicinamibacterales bacterium]